MSETTTTETKNIETENVTSQDFPTPDKKADSSAPRYILDAESISLFMGEGDRLEEIKEALSEEREQSADKKNKAKGKEKANPEDALMIAEAENQGRKEKLSFKEKFTRLLRELYFLMLLLIMFMLNPKEKYSGKDFEEILQSQSPDKENSGAFSKLLFKDNEGKSWPEFLKAIGQLEEMPAVNFINAVLQLNAIFTPRVIEPEKSRVSRKNQPAKSLFPRHAQPAFAAAKK